MLKCQGRRRKGEQIQANDLGGRYGYAATRGSTGCSCLLPILLETQCYCLLGAQANIPARTLVGAMSNNLGGRYGYAATRGSTGCSCLLPILPEAQCYDLVGAQANIRATTLVGAMGMPQPLGPRAAPAFRQPCREPKQQQPWAHALLLPFAPFAANQTL